MIIHGTGDEVVKFDGASIISHKDEITNPNVVYKEIDGKLNGHSNIFMTEEGEEYLEELNEEYDELDKQDVYKRQTFYWLYCRFFCGYRSYFSALLRI